MGITGDTIADESIVGIYDTMGAVEAAVRALDQGRFPVRQISIVAPHRETEQGAPEFIAAVDVAKGDASAGVRFGGRFGSLMGGAFLAVPGWGISQEHISEYEAHVRGGRYLVVAHGSAEAVARAHTILRAGPVATLHHHVGAVPALAD